MRRDGASFDAIINGATVLTNFDIYAVAGDHNFTAVVKPFSNIVANSSGQIVIAFKDGAVDCGNGMETTGSLLVVVLQ